MQLNVLKGEPKTYDHLERHPFGKVPVLDHDGMRILETSAIARYLNDVLPGKSLIPPTPKDRARVDMITGMIDSYGYGALLGGVVAYHLFPDFVGGKSDSVRKGGLGNGRKMIDFAMKTWGSSPFIAGDLGSGLIDQPRRLSRRLAINQAVRPERVELEHPIANDLKRHTANLRRLGASCAFANRRQSQKATCLRALCFDRFAEKRTMWASKSVRSLVAWRTSSVRRLNHLEATSNIPNRVTLSGIWCGAMFVRRRTAEAPSAAKRQARRTSPSPVFSRRPAMTCDVLQTLALLQGLLAKKVVGEKAQKLIRGIDGF